MKIATLGLVIAMIASPCVTQTQDSTLIDQQIVIRQLETDQRLVYARNLGLTDEESRAFWPIYDAYEAAIKRVTDQRLQLLNDYADEYRTLSDPEADAMLERLWKCEQEALRIRQRYAKQVQKVLPGAKALRYVQVQARIDNLLLGRVISLVPLAQ